MVDCILTETINHFGGVVATACWQVEKELLQEKLSHAQRKNMLDDFEKFSKIYEKFKKTGLKEIQIGDTIVRLDCDSFSLFTVNTSEDDPG